MVALFYNLDKTHFNLDNPAIVRAFVILFERSDARVDFVSVRCVSDFMVPINPAHKTAHSLDFSGIVRQCFAHV